MSLIGLVVVLILVGVGLYIVDQIEMDATIKKLIKIVVIVVVAIWLLENLGVFSMGPTIYLGHR